MANCCMKTSCFVSARYSTHSCTVFVGLVKPGRNAADVICPSSGDQHVNATVRRDGSAQRQGTSDEKQNATAVVAQEQRVDGADPGGASAEEKEEEERGWERTSAGSRQTPNPEIVFKCVDAETTVVVGSTVEEREGRFIGGACPNEASVSSAATVNEISTGTNPDNSTGARALQDEHSAVTTPLHEEEGRREKRKELAPSVDKGFEDDDIYYAGGARGATSAAAKSLAVTISDSGNGEEVVDDHDRHQPSSMPASHQPPTTTTTAGITADSRPSSQAFGAEEVRPQVCVPIMGAGDSGCIGMVVVQGFTTGALIDDDSWRDWFVHRMDPLNRGENRNVKRLKLVRPRGLPKVGKLEHVPTGTAAKVVYGSVEKISRKRGMPVYAVR